MSLARAVIALVLFVIFFGVAIVLRMWQQYKLTGHHGFYGTEGAMFSKTWWPGVLLVLTVLLTLAGIVADFYGIGLLVPVTPPITLAAAALITFAIVALYASQLAMGKSWRIGVKSDDRTELVVHGPFRYTRNPIYLFFLVGAVGFLLLIPNLVSLVACGCAFAAMIMQVHFVEEPYLIKTHGDAYVAYGRKVGRFLPGLGRFR